MIVGVHWNRSGGHRDRDRSIVAAHDEVRIAGWVEVDKAELEGELTARTSIDERQIRAWLVVHGEGRETDCVELSKAQCELAPWNEEIEVAVRVVEAAGQERRLRHAPEDEEGRLER
jgi:hypothetical protein